MSHQPPLKRRRIQPEPPAPFRAPVEPRLLLQREQSGGLPGKVLQSAAFSSMRVQQEWDIVADLLGDLPRHLARGQGVRELLEAEGIVFVCTQRGACAAYTPGSDKVTCWLNRSRPSPAGWDGGDVIRSMFYNQHRGSLVLVSVNELDEYQALSCREVPLDSIKAGQPQQGSMPVFATESLSWPGFIEFDDVNDVVLSFSAEAGQYRVWDLRDYSLLHQFPSQGVSDVKISPGAILLSMRQQGGRLPLRVLAVATGAVVAEPELEVDPGPMVELVELFGRHLLLKQQGSPLRMLDLASGRERRVPGFRAPLAFIYTDLNAQFLTFHEDGMEVWGFGGRRLAAVAECAAPSSLGFANCVYLTSGQDMLVSYRAPLPAAGAGPAPAPCVAVHDCVRGARVAALAADAPGAGGALEGTTALFYSEARREAYTGDGAGRVRLWAC